jgi:hypothetical protein
MMKLLSIVCFLCALGLFVLAWRGTLGLTLHVYTFIFQPRHLLLTAIAFAVAGCVAAFAPHP